MRPLSRSGPAADTGETCNEVIAAKPSAEFDAEWGGGFMQPDVWIGIVYGGMTKK